MATLFHIEDGDLSRTVALKGRVRLTLLRLLAADRHGITAHNFPVGARLAHYVWKLRTADIPVETEMESHEGEFPGVHARYRLAARVRIRTEMVR